jgi:hypothetical protein
VTTPSGAETRTAFIIEGQSEARHQSKSCVVDITGKGSDAMNSPWCKPAPGGRADEAGTGG